MPTQDPNVAVDKVPPLRVGDEVRLRVEQVAHGGHMVGRCDGFVVFVRYALPGEEVIAEITDVRKGFARGDAIRIVAPHPDRVTSPCSAFGPGGCGGCDFQHASAALQRQLKLHVVQEALERYGRLSRARVEELTAGGVRDLGIPFRWRTRMRFEVPDRQARDGEQVRVFMHRHRSDQLVDASDCAISDPLVLQACKAQAERLHERRSIIAAVGDDDCVGVADEPVREFSKRQGKRQTVPTVKHVLPGPRGPVEFETPIDAFWQIHPLLGEEINTCVRDYGRPAGGEVWWDLYAGMGPLALSIAADLGPTGKVLAVESSRRAVEIGRQALADVSAVDLQQGDVPAWLRKAAKHHIDGVIMDPPRSGAGRQVVEQIALRKPRVVVYVACDPVALARDTAYFAECGYRLEQLRMWDAFPQTHHLEAAAAFVPADQIS